ncbi:MAG: formylglycine-generating enzyme family protein [Phaeodactylibacter xiamenensis]|uniref:formylglycine-generating enzyme family protein n=1 Tax=Phaeodactylibacter xiamenensis TaxID=1524460 RepID=UPI000698AA84|nr:SUMF1/EgtB/PvdO family nonheme iron enzyme [Phaeodactylibacter xiamenensis]MCR9054184.1 formylglycine-generating enzyme family protein [bacterium]
MSQDLPNTYRHPLPNGLYYDMIRVRPGVFVMGSEAEEAFDREKPEHLVRITQNYYIGVYPVTQAFWKAVMNGHNPSYFQGDDRPVEQVSWQDIVEGGQDDRVTTAFLNQLNQNFASEIPDYQFRLPTEAEWEYAAKGGHKTALSPEQVQSFLTTNQPKAAELYTAYAGSDQLKEVGWYDKNSHEETKAVGKRQPNELGLYDMSGNVSEWCEDWFDSDFYKKCKEQGIMPDPLNAEKGLLRVHRGGSWFGGAGRCRVSDRYHWFPTRRDGYVGFRLVLAPVQ